MFQLEPRPASTISNVDEPRLSPVNEKEQNNEINNELPLYKKTYEERRENYEVARKRIFGESVVPARILKCRQRYKQRKRNRSVMVSTVQTVSTIKNDPRPYAEIEILGKKLKGLLDSGASVCVLGRGARDLVGPVDDKIIWCHTSVRTAGGSHHPILGKISLPVKYKNEINDILFYICPSLDQEIYLGVDFWIKFSLAPEIFATAAIQMEDVLQNLPELSREHYLKPHTLTPKQQAELEDVIKQFATFESNGLGRTHLETHKIELIEGAVPVKDRHYPISPAVQEIVFKEIDEMLGLDVIKVSESPWSNRTTVVRKPGKNRFCLDARKLNERTKKDAYPLQNIDGILSRIDYTQYISSVDLKCAFWQIPLEEASKEYTAFTVAGRPLYQFEVMPFGLCNAAQRLCRLMDKVIPAKLKMNVFTYLDDLLIIAPDFETHMRALQEVAKCLRAANLTIGLKKSNFCFQELRYLGYIVGGGRLRTDPEKIVAIQKLKMPTSVKEVRSFLGTAGWYRRFIKNYAMLSAPISDCLKKRTPFYFSPEAEEAVNELKRALTTAPVLIHPNFKLKFYIQCDASDKGIGAVLYQKDEEGNEQPIAFFSRKLNPSQRNYSVTEKECLAAVKAIDRFRPYVEMMEFTVVTDHASLKWLMTLKDLSGRLARWSLALQGYDFTITHCKGSANVVADTLSRYVEAITLQLAEIDEGDEEAFQTNEYLDRIKTVEENGEKLPDLKIEDGRIYKKSLSAEFPEIGERCWKLWIPETLTTKLIQKAHEEKTAAHGGIAKTLERLRRFYYWPKMPIQVREYIKKCTICQETKPWNHVMKPPMGNEVITDRPFQKLYIDFLGKYPRSKSGHCYIFIVVDHFTKFTFLKAMREATAKEVVKFLVQEIFHKFGVPEVIHSDNGVQFTSKDFQSLMSSYKITHMRNAFHSPQSNASERVNQSVLSAIRAYLEEDHRDWDLYLTEIECALRNSVHSSTGTTPYFALFGQHMFTSGADYKLARKLSLMDDVEILSKSDNLALLRDKIKENMHQAYERSAKQYNLKVRMTKFFPGQEVYKRNFVLSDFKNNINAKFCRKFIKCRITKVLGNNMYEIESLNGHPLGIFHAKDLKQ